MPVPKPRAGEGQSNFVSRCIGQLRGEGYEQFQATAICYDAYRRKEDENKEVYAGMFGNINPKIDNK